jgi:hypothetical protein
MVAQVQVELGVRKRRAWQALGEARAVPRYTPPVRADEAPQAGRTIELVLRYHLSFCLSDTPSAAIRRIAAGDSLR